MISPRLLFTCGALLVLAKVLGVLGAFAGMPLLEWKLGVLRQSQVVFTSPGEYGWIPVTTATMFAWPPLSTVVAVVLHRWRRRADASALLVAACFAVPVALLVAHAALRAHQLGELAAGSSVQPMIPLRSLGPGFDEAGLLGFASVCVWLYVGTRKPAPSTGAP